MVATQSGDSRVQLREFLKQCRARVSPAEVGLVASERRHTPGLRREEVAVLAGVSASWYTWLEQGRRIKASDAVLDAIARALQMTAVERAHLYRLSGHNAPAPVGDSSAADASRLARLVSSWQPAPAYVIDRYWNTLAANSAAQDLLGVRPDVNLLAEFFLDCTVRRRYLDWESVAAQFVGQFRAQSARFPRDLRFAELADELNRRSATFSRLWTRHEVRGCGAYPLQLRRGRCSTESYDLMSLGIFEGIDLAVMICLPREEGAARPGPGEELRGSEPTATDVSVPVRSLAS